VKRAIVAALVALAGCRGILGIESLEVVGDGGSDGGPEDATTSDADHPGDASGPSKDSGDATPPPDGGGPRPLALPDGAPPNDSGCQYQSPTGSDPCQPCCHMAFPAGFDDMAVAAIAAGCLCQEDGGGCGGECGSAFCANPAGSMPSSSCNMCLDKALGATCAPALTTCTSADCINARSCLASCGGPPP
jgi:hypothetical protein